MHFPALILLISLTFYASAQIPNKLFKQVWLTVNAIKSHQEYALGLSSYLSVLCRISFPFFHRLIAGGEAWGLHSRVTWLPERAFSRAFNGLLEKLGGEAERRGAEKGMVGIRMNLGNLYLCISAVQYRDQPPSAFREGTSNSRHELKGLGPTRLLQSVLTCVKTELNFSSSQ